MATINSPQPKIASFWSPVSLCHSGSLGVFLLRDGVRLRVDGVRLRVDARRLPEDARRLPEDARLLEVLRLERDFVARFVIFISLSRVFVY